MFSTNKNASPLRELNEEQLTHVTGGCAKTTAKDHKKPLPHHQQPPAPKPAPAAPTPAPMAPHASTTPKC